MICLFIHTKQLACNVLRFFQPFYDAFTLNITGKPLLKLRLSSLESFSWNKVYLEKIEKSISIKHKSFMFEWFTIRWGQFFFQNILNFQLTSSQFFLTEQLRTPACEYWKFIFLSATKIYENTTNILNCYFSN